MCNISSPQAAFKQGGSKAARTVIRIHPTGNGNIRPLLGKEIELMFKLLASYELFPGCR